MPIHNLEDKAMGMAIWLLLDQHLITNHCKIHHKDGQSHNIFKLNPQFVGSLQHKWLSSYKTTSLITVQFN